MKPKFKCGDIISSESGNTWIVAQASNNTGCYFGFDANSTYTLPYERQDNFTKIGEFPMNTIENAIDDAKRQSLDLQTQVNIAVYLMGKFLDVDGMDTLLVLQDIRVDKDKNMVFIQCSAGGGKPNRWITVVDICEKYGVNNYGVQ